MKDVRRITTFEARRKGGKVLIHSPRGTTIMVKPEELPELIKLLEKQR